MQCTGCWLSKQRLVQSCSKLMSDLWNSLENLSVTHRRHRVDGYISRARLQLHRVTRVEVSDGRVSHGASGSLGLDGVALRGPGRPHRAAVELSFLEVALWARGRGWRRVAGLGAWRRRHVGVLGYVGVLRAGEVRRRLHGLTARVIQTWAKKKKKKKQVGEESEIQQRKNNKRKRWGHVI